MGPDSEQDQGAEIVGQEVASMIGVSIGIEQYSAGRGWDLDGPASDAVKILQYWRDSGVPKENLYAFIAPLETNNTLNDLAQGLACSVLRPDEQDIESFLTGALAEFSTELLWIHWGGHGIVSSDGGRRLFTSDAESSNSRNLDLSDLMVTLRTDRYSGLCKQVFTIDACSNYVLKPDSALPHRTLAKGDPTAANEQFALLGASVGEYASNLNADKSGLMFRELLTLLKESPWQPDFSLLAQKIGERFISLRRQGKASQTPSTLWFRDWRGGEQTIADIDDKKVPVASSPVRPTLSASQNAELRDAMLRVAMMKTGCNLNSWQAINN